MGTPWDHAAAKYIQEWVPRFVPYHLDLVRELAIAPGQRVLVTCAGPGAEVLAVARAVGEHGTVRAIDTDAEMIGVCASQVKKAGFTWAIAEQARPRDVGEGNWSAIVCAFGLWPLSAEERALTLETWAKAITTHGKVGVLTFGPPDDANPFEILSKALRELEPAAATRPTRIDPAREAMESMFDAAGLALVRHTVLRHPVSFSTAEAFTDAIREGRTWRRVWEELGPERIGRVLARFYDETGGPTAPLAFEPAVTLAIAAKPGAEIELANRPSIKVPEKPPSLPPPAAKPPPDPYKD